MPNPTNTCIVHPPKLSSLSVAFCCPSSGACPVAFWLQNNVQIYINTTTSQEEASEVLFFSFALYKLLAEQEDVYTD